MNNKEQIKKNITDLETRIDELESKDQTKNVVNLIAKKKKKLQEWQGKLTDKLKQLNQ